MQVGDLVYCKGGLPEYDRTGIVLKDNKEGGTVKIHDTKDGSARWVVRSACRVISESR